MKTLDNFLREAVAAPTAGTPQKTRFSDQDREEANQKKKKVPTDQYMTAPDDGKSATRRYQRQRHQDNYRANRGKAWRKSAQKQGSKLLGSIMNHGRKAVGSASASSGSGGDSDVQFKSSN